MLSFCFCVTTIQGSKVPSLDSSSKASQFPIEASGCAFGEVGALSPLSVDLGSRESLGTGEGGLMMN